MSKLSVVLDACVLFPMYLRDTLLSTAEAGLYLPYWSQKILDEAMSNLVRQGILCQEKAINLEAEINAAFPEAIIEVPVGLEQIMKNDPKDRHVLAAAVTAKADVIVTSNLADFKAKDLAPWNIKSLSPDEFMSELFDEYPDLIVRLLRQQSQRYKKPPKTVAELLEFLEKKAGMPKFASDILLYEYSLDMVQTAETVLRNYGRKIPEGGKFLEGDRYRIWQQEKTLTITAKDGRGEILRFQNEEIEGNISSEDIKALKIFAQSWDRELTINRVEEQQAD
ncbi:PIN domain-containing protein [Microcoleus sp. T3_B1]|uniref:PIN domain-containing protein n=1 Tax=Microcoleus sp. T3_B1 TaxID=3055425 RepID=UPI002FD1809D